jgi:hypothetical protein
VYNITTKVDNNISAEWISWQKEIHIPEVLSTGFFYDFRFFELLGDDNGDDKTFVIQYFALQLEDYKIYNEKFAPLIRDKAFEKWGDQCISFRTLLKSVH